MQINLNQNDSVTAVLSGAAATTNPNASVQSRDRSAFRTTRVALSGATAVTLLSAPNPDGATLDGLSIYNPDTAAVTLTLAHVFGGTSYTISTLTLQVGDTLVMDAVGLRVVDSSGQLKQSGVSTQVQPFAIGLMRFTKTDGITVLPASAATTSHGMVLGTDGTNFPHLETLDGKAATTAVVSRCVSVPLPANYVAGSAITIRVRAGMKTTISDTTAVVALNVYSNLGTTQAGSADLNTTSAQSCNSLTNANLDFVVTPTGLVAGQELHIKLTQTITDGATATAVIGVINHVELRTSVSQ